MLTLSLYPSQIRSLKHRSVSAKLIYRREALAFLKKKKTVQYVNGAVMDFSWFGSVQQAIAFKMKQKFRLIQYLLCCIT